MGKRNQKEKDKTGAQSLNCKLLTTLLLIFIVYPFTVVHFLPPSFSPYPYDLSLCLSKLPTTAPPHNDVLLPSGALKRSFNPHVTAAYAFILMSAYRGGLQSFTVIALSPKFLHFYSAPSYQCQWVPRNSSAPTATAAGHKYLPQRLGFSRVYTFVVINCAFSDPIGLDGSGGGSLLLVITSTNGDKTLNVTDTVEALVEQPNTLNASYYTDPQPKYEYLYCGSPLFGKISPQRVREWLAYHVMLFGGNSHFVMYDAGGVDEAVMEVLRPWMEKGFVSLHDVREQQRFDGFYFYNNQFLIVNDCLHRYKFDAKWIFFFDVDEFIYVRKNGSIKSVTDSVSGYMQFTIPERIMACDLCLSEDEGLSNRKWGFEKLVYRDVEKVAMKMHKYAVQPRNVFATGVHQSLHGAGKLTHQIEDLIRYYHYPGVVAKRKDPCHKFYNATAITLDGNPYVMDTELRGIAETVKRFELDTIGPRLQATQE